MEVSPNALRKDTVTTLREVEDHLDNKFLDANGKAQLLAAKATCLNTLVLLSERRTS